MNTTHDLLITLTEVKGSFYDLAHTVTQQPPTHEHEENKVTKTDS